MAGLVPENRQGSELLVGYISSIGCKRAEEEKAKKTQEKPEIIRVRLANKH